MTKDRLIRKLWRALQHTWHVSARRLENGKAEYLLECGACGGRQKKYEEAIPHKPGCVILKMPNDIKKSQPSLWGL